MNVPVAGGREGMPPAIPSKGRKHCRQSKQNQGRRGSQAGLGHPKQFDMTKAQVVGKDSPKAKLELD